MKKVIDTEKIPIKLWLDDIEEGALLQAKNLANLPFAFQWVSIMPDSHQGFGMPIGGVLATTDVIIPNAVGVDIGCGMCAIQTPVTEIDTDTLKKIMGNIRKEVPVGFAHHKVKQKVEKMPHTNIDGKPVIQKEFEHALTQIGSLGGGNHFLEIQQGNDGHVWLMIHSGSRNLGYKSAAHYNNLAVDLNQKWHVPVPKAWELAYLPLDSKEGQEYVETMKYCVDFALANRKLMMERVVDIFMAYTNPDKNIKLSDMINIAHNYAAIENHYGKNVWVHRKGATKANEGLTGIIPGSMGSSSYIVEGKGNPESFKSCSHGAGRKMARRQAQRELNLEEEQAKMAGIIHGLRGVKNLDEAPGSYKDIDTVMANQTDLVEIKVKLKPLASIKG